MWNFLFLAFQWHRGKRGFVILSWRFWPFCCTRSRTPTELNGACAHLREIIFKAEIPHSRLHPE